MLDLLARKSTRGDLTVNLARHHLLNHEWGLARMAVEDALSKGRLSEPDAAQLLLEEVCSLLGIITTPTQSH